MTKEQAHMWLDRKSWQVDMSFKRCYQRQLNEIVFAAPLGEIGKITTFARVFMESRTAAAYEKMFERTFEAVQKITSRQIKWLHIDGSMSDARWEAVVTDMDQGQFKGICNMVQSCSVS